MKFVRRFDYIVVNEQDRPNEAVRDLEAILQAERFRIHPLHRTTRSARRIVNEPVHERNYMSKSVFGDLDALLEHADSKFSLVNIVTKRARQLNNWIRVQQLPPADRREFFASEPLVDRETINPNKPVSIALDEIAEGKIHTSARARASSNGRRMCGIVGYIGERDSVPIILDSLGRLEYRGYDSAGIAVIDASRRAGRLQGRGQALAAGRAAAQRRSASRAASAWATPAGPRTAARRMPTPTRIWIARGRSPSSTTASSRTTRRCAPR